MFQLPWASSTVAGRLTSAFKPAACFPPKVLCPGTHCRGQQANLRGLHPQHPGPAGLNIVCMCHCNLS